jgi:hypothetical protein
MSTTLFGIKIILALGVFIVITLILESYIREIKEQEDRNRLAQEGMNPLSLVPLVFQVIVAAIEFLGEFPKRMNYMIDSIMLIGAGFYHEITGLAEGVPIIVKDSVKIVSCGIKHAGNFNECAKYYAMSLIGSTVYSILVKLPIFIIKTLTGLDVQYAIDMIWEMIQCLDDFIFGMSGFHISKYPDSIIETCYNCDLPDSGNVNKVLGLLGKPAIDFINGAITFMSVFTGKKPRLM